MAESATEICNIALGLIGQRRITSLDDNTLSAQTCKSFYASSRDALLELAHWRFATARKNLALTGTPPSEWMYQYAYPSDCLKPRYIASGYRRPARNQEVPFVVELDDENSRVILTTRASAELVYTRRIEVVGYMTAGFADFLASRLAQKLIGPLRANDNRRPEVKAALERAAGEALLEVVDHGTPEVEPDAEWIRARS